MGNPADDNELIIDRFVGWPASDRGSIRMRTFTPRLFCAAMSAFARLGLSMNQNAASISTFSLLMRVSNGLRQFSNDASQRRSVADAGLKAKKTTNESNRMHVLFRVITTYLPTN